MEHCYHKNTYQILLNTKCDELNDLYLNCIGIELSKILEIIDKISKCTKLKKIFITNISNEYSEKINFDFLANFGIGDIDISFTHPFFQITSFVSCETLLILGNLQTNLDVRKIISTDFRSNTKIYIRADKFKQIAIIMNNLSTNVHNLKIHVDNGFDEVFNFIDSGLNNLPCSLTNLKIYYNYKFTFNNEYFNKLIEQLENIKRPFGCNLIIKKYCGIYKYNLLFL
jgi:hypothetical protein